jgi:uncharacterized membrane protein YgcG
MIPVTVSAMVLCITAYGSMGLVIVWTQRSLVVVFAQWVQGSMTRLFCTYCCCCCRCCCRFKCCCSGGGGGRRRHGGQTGTEPREDGDKRSSSPRQIGPPASDLRIVEERTIAQVEQVVRFFPWLIVCLFVASSTIVLGLVKWLPTILILNYFIGNAMYLVAKVQITSAQCTGLGIAEGLLLIYFSLGRSWVKALFLFPRHLIKSQTHRLLRGVHYRLAPERILDFAWRVGMAVPGFDSIGGLWRAGTGASAAWPARNGEGEDGARAAADASGGGGGGDGGGGGGGSGGGARSDGGSGSGRRSKKKRRSTRSRWYENSNNGEDRGEDELGATHKSARNTLAKDRDAPFRRHRRFSSFDSGNMHEVREVVHAASGARALVEQTKRGTPKKDAARVSSVRRV